MTDAVALERRKVELWKVLSSAALLSDARLGDREAVATLADAREELRAVERELSVGGVA